MRSALAKMDCDLAELQEILERGGDRSLLLTPIQEAFAEYNPNNTTATAAQHVAAAAGNKLGTESNESSRQDMSRNESSRLSLEDSSIT